MDIEKLIEQLRSEAATFRPDSFAQTMLLDAATAISTLQAENEKLRAELQKSEHDNMNLTGELAKVAAELEQVKRERDALIEDFVDYVTGGVPNPAIFCKNRCNKCVDMSSWCTGKDCKGFYPSGASGQMDKNCGTCNWYNDGTCLNDQSSVYKTGEHNTCPHWETYDEGMWGEV